MKKLSGKFGMAVLLLGVAYISQQAANAVTDTTPPTGTIVINGNRSATNSPSVTLKLTWDDGAGGTGVSRMRFSDDGAHWTAWEAPAATRAYTLPGADGHKTVRVQYLDKANNRSAAYSDYINLDTTAPTGTIVINGGAVTTGVPSVMLGLTWADGAGVGVTRMRFSDNGSTWTPWEAPKTPCAHSFPSTPGYHTVRVQYLDGAGNYSAVCSDYIKYVPAVEQTATLPGGVPLVMVWVPQGAFTMGSPDTEQDRGTNESPQHSVNVKGFWMAKYEVTKRQWQAVMGSTPWSGQSFVVANLDSPAVWINWNDAQSFLTELNGYTGEAFRLPSEAEWEYACRAGSQVPPTRFYWGEDPAYSSINNYAWWYQNTYNVRDYGAHAAGLKLPNAFDLYDMSGNAWEWCADWYHGTYEGAPADGNAWNSPEGVDRVIRGGSWFCGDVVGACCRSAERSSLTAAGTGSSIGFRIAKTS